MNEDPWIQTNFSIKENFRILQSKIKEAAKKAHRAPEEIHIIAVAKTKPLETVQEGLASGIFELGENKVQEAEDKWPRLQGDFLPHFIGHLQKNKAKKIVPLTPVIHSIDKLETAQALEKELTKAEQERRSPKWDTGYLNIPHGKMGYFVQVNSTQEESKFGVPPEQTRGLLEQLLELDHLLPLGLMTIGPTEGDVAENRASFARTRELLQKLQDLSPHLRYLSMGMTGDYFEAIMEGATHVRLGSAIFGKRSYSAGEPFDNLG
jgi:pyridoxal phosphate enzyme (YggS family)